MRRVNRSTTDYQVVGLTPPWLWYAVWQEECNRNDALAARLAELEGGAPVQQQNGVHAAEGGGA